jgi:hypothetical protein
MRVGAGLLKSELEAEQKHLNRRGADNRERCSGIPRLVIFGGLWTWGWPVLEKWLCVISSSHKPGRGLAFDGKIGAVIFCGFQGLQVNKTLLYAANHSFNVSNPVCNSLSRPHHGSQPSGFLPSCPALHQCTSDKSSTTELHPRPFFIFIFRQGLTKLPILALSS